MQWQQQYQLRRGDSNSQITKPSWAYFQYRAEEMSGLDLEYTQGTRLRTPAK